MDSPPPTQVDDAVPETGAFGETDSTTGASYRNGTAFEDAPPAATRRDTVPAPGGTSA